MKVRKYPVKNENYFVVTKDNAEDVLLSELEIESLAGEILDDFFCLYDCVRDKKNLNESIFDQIEREEL